MCRILVCSLLLCLAHAQNVTKTEPLWTYVDNDQLAENCTECLPKCCPGTKISLAGEELTCVDNVYNVSELQDFEVNIYKKDIRKKIIKTEKTLKNFKFVYSDVWNNSFDMSGEPLYLLEDGSLFYRVYNYLDSWPHQWASSFHCLEVQVTISNGTLDPGSARVIHLVRLPDGEESGDDTINNIKVSAMVISCISLLLVLVAYLVLPKRNLPALMLMSFVSCLFTAFLFRAIQLLAEDLEKGWCTFIGLMEYSTLWASFTWMNVMSYDLWSTTCAMHIRWQSRGKVLSKFLWYCVYGFGVPLLLTAFMVGVDHADFSVTPEFVKPHFVASPFCYFENEAERKLYVNSPILVATMINVVFFIMTAVYIWRNSSKPGGGGDSRNTKKDQNRFVIYVKLALITGVPWVLDCISLFLAPDHWVWVAADVFNFLGGLFIFIIFVCKRDMLVQLCKRFKIKTSFVRRWESTVVTSVSVTKRQLSDKEIGPNEQKPEFLTEKAGFN